MKLRLKESDSWNFLVGSFPNGLHVLWWDLLWLIQCKTQSEANMSRPPPYLLSLQQNVSGHGLSDRCTRHNVSRFIWKTTFPLIQIVAISNSGRKPFNQNNQNLLRDQFLKAWYTIYTEKEILLWTWVRRQKENSDDWNCWNCWQQSTLGTFHASENSSWVDRV